MCDASVILDWGEGTEEVIYAESKTVLVFTLKKEKKEVRKTFWNLIRTVEEEEDQEDEGLDQEEIMFGTGMETDTEVEGAGGSSWEADQSKEETTRGNQRGWGGETLSDRGWKEEEEKIQRGRGRATGTL